MKICLLKTGNRHPSCRRYWNSYRSSMCFYILSFACVFAIFLQLQFKFVSRFLAAFVNSFLQKRVLAFCLKYLVDNSGYILSKQIVNSAFSYALQDLFCWVFFICPELQNHNFLALSSTYESGTQILCHNFIGAKVNCHNEAETFWGKSCQR